MLKERLRTGDVSKILQKGVDGADKLIKSELALEPRAVGQLRPATRWNLQKVFKFRDASYIDFVAKKAQDHIVRLSSVGCLLYAHPFIRIFCWRNLF